MSLQKIKKLIENSGSLSKKEKEIYLVLINIVPKPLLKDLQKILEDEAKEAQIIKEKGQKATTQIYQKYIDKLENFFEAEEKKAIAAEESEEDAQSEEVLDKLKDL